MIYGFEDSLLYDNKPLFELTQKELFELSEKYNLFMYQTHPFRDGVKVGDPKFMHGVECFNGHYHHNNNNLKAKEFCEKNYLIKVVGTDFHHDDQPITTAVLVPENINDSISLTNYIRTNKLQTIEDKDTYIEQLLKNKSKRGIDLKRSDLCE